jgi:hypothetical protein
MDVKVVSNEVTTRLKSFFENIPSNVNKELIKHSFSSGNLEDIFSMITQYKEPGRGNMLILSEMLNLYAQIDINQATALISHIGELDEVGLAGLQINGEMSLKHNCSCLISGCDFNYLALRYSDDDSLIDNVSLHDCFIHTLKITFNSSMCKKAMYGIDIESEIHKWINSGHTKVIDLQIWYR